MIMHGDGPGELTESSGGGPLEVSEQDMNVCATPVVGPIWRGGFDMLGSDYGNLDGLIAFMPKTSYSKLVVVVESIPSSLYFGMKKRHEVWPENFDELGAAANNVELYFVPEFSRSEKDYNNLVEYMISNDLAMTCDLGSLKLMVFTSLEQLDTEQQQNQGKFYLWGMFEGEKLRENQASQCNNSIPVESRICTSLNRKGCENKPRIRSLMSSCLGKNGSGFKQGRKRDKTRTVLSHVKRDHFPSLGSNCKRKRSKRRKISSSLGKNVNLGEGIIASDQAKGAGDELATFIRAKEESNVEEIASKLHDLSSDHRSDEAAASVMESPKEISRSLVMLASPAGEIFLHRGPTSISDISYCSPSTPTFRTCLINNL